MSDIPSGALDAGRIPGGQPAGARHPAAPGRAARRPQALHRGIDDQRAARARADPHHAGDRRGVRGVVRDLLQRLPGQLLAALVDAGVGGAARRSSPAPPASTSTGPRRPARGSPWAAARFPARTAAPPLGPRSAVPPPSSSRSAWIRSRTAAGSGSTSPPTPRSRCTAPAGTPAARARPGQRRGRHPDVQPAVGLRQRARRTDVGSVGGQGDRRGDRVRPGHQEGHATTPASRPPPPRWATGCPYTTSPTSAAPAATAGSCTRR